MLNLITKEWTDKTGAITPINQLEDSHQSKPVRCCF